MTIYWNSTFASGLVSVLALVGAILGIIVLFLTAAALLKYLQKK